MTDLLKELTHYICWKTDDPAKLGATKLNKALWFSDTIAYRANGRSITNTTYVKRQFGPVPRRILPVLEELRDEGKVISRERTHFGYKQREFVAILPPGEDDVFSRQELEIVDMVIAWICDDHTASSISELTHDSVWEAAQDGEEIPMFAVLGALAGEITDDDKSWANDIIAKR